MTSAPNFKPEAAAEVEEAYFWYETQSPGLGSEFLRSLEACLSQIRRFPGAAPDLHQGMRRALLRRFPFGVFYLSSGESLTVYAVFHCGREPSNLINRFK